MVDHVIVGEIATNCWIVSPDGEEGCTLIDPGGDPPAIIARLRRLNYRPRYIVLTHAHFDHIAALPDLAAAYEDAEIAIHREEAERLGPGSYELHRKDFAAAAGNAVYVDSLWKPMPFPARLLAEGDRIGPFRVLHLPGHSPGSSGYLLEEEKLLFSGDTLFRGGIGRTDLPGGDWDALQQTLKRLFAMDGDIRVCPGHGPVTTIGREKGNTR
jgi:glyoxylase-like metal-dependent hydrolase (beta-lactamase superfamily II)